MALGELSAFMNVRIALLDQIKTCLVEHYVTTNSLQLSGSRRAQKWWYFLAIC